jgi:deoxyribose-phosphate aldolase
MDLTLDQVRHMLDVAQLSPTATPAEVEELAETVRREDFRFICVHSLHTKRAADILKGSKAKVVSCVGFPQGVVRSSLKALEAEGCAEDGAGEIDMVMALGALKAGDRAYVEADIRAVVMAVRPLPVKVIIETPWLSDREKVLASMIIRDAGAAFVKTCTGCSPDPIALFEDVRLIRKTVGPDFGIKASGRVGSYFRLASMVEAGATRVGLVLPQAREIIRGWEESRPA